MGRGDGDQTRSGLRDAAPLSRSESGESLREAQIRELSAAWGPETSADPAGWSEQNPSHGQCAVSSMIIQDRFGGELLRTTVGGVSHYLNRLPSGEELDVSFEQFPPGSVYDAPPELRERSYVESHEPTVARYEELRRRLSGADSGR